MKTFFLALILFLCSCSHLTVVRQSSKAETRPNSVTVHSLFWGLVPLTGRLDEARLCPEGRLARLDVRTGALDLVLSVLSLGVYLPQSLTAHCSGPQHNLIVYKTVR